MKKNVEIRVLFQRISFIRKIASYQYTANNMLLRWQTETHLTVCSRTTWVGWHK